MGYAKVPSISFTCILIVGIFATLASAQSTQKKPSIWQQMKDAAKQAQPPGQSQQQPQAPPGQQQPKANQGQRRGQQAAGQGQSGGQTNDSGPFQPPPGTKIEEKIVAPLQEQAKFEVSPHGVHVATIENDGSRAVVYYDGVEGPKFDEILAQDSNYRIAFSPDGNRYAYCARGGNQYVVMVDGKELVRSSESLGGSFSGLSCKLGFTSNNKHVFYFSTASVSDPSTVNFSRFVFDGKASPPRAAVGPDTSDVAFSPDGDHYAYVWNDPKKLKPWMLIVDGKPAPYQGGGPQWTNDSKHLYTQRPVQGGSTELLFDGKPLTRAFSFKVYIPPVGDMVVVAVTGGVNFHPLSFLVVNGKKVPGSETVERGSIDDVVFSPDGKHYAAKCGDINSHHYVITDGKRGQEYNSVEKLAFTPDASTVVYSASVNGKSFVVVGDQEFGGSSAAVTALIAPAGNRVAGFIYSNGNPSLLINKKVTRLDGRGGADLGFSPDGTRYAYFAIDAGNGSRLVIDGVTQPQSVLNNVDTMDLGNSQALKYIFSPDSKHVAHFAAPPTPTGGAQRGIFLDGTFIPAGIEGTNSQLAFSPDSKHLFWIHAYGNNPYRLFIDGKPLVDFYSASNTVGTIPHWWDFDADGNLLFLAQDDNSLKRIMVTLPSETNVATLSGH